MKRILRYSFIFLALATAGLFAQAATEPVAPSVRGHATTVKVAKKGKKKGHKKHKKHKKGAN